MQNTKEPLLAKILRVSVYAAGFMPLIIFSQFISPFHFGKVIIFRSLVELMLPAYLILVWQDRSYKPKTNWIFWSFLSFAAAFSVTTLASVIPYASFWGSLERMGGLWTFWHYFIFFVIATSVLNTKEHWRNFMLICLNVGLLSSIYGALQKTEWSFIIGSGGRERIFGTIGNAALFAGYELVNLFLALTIYLNRKNETSDLKINNRDASERASWSVFGLAITIISYLVFCWAVHSDTGETGRLLPSLILLIPMLFGVYKTIRSGEERIWLPFAIAIQGWAIMMTVVRGSVMGLGIGLFLFTLLYYLNYNSKKAKLAVLAVVAATALFFTITLTPIKQASIFSETRFFRRLMDTSFESYTAKTRFWAWQAGFKGWSEGPKTVLLGWGPENFNVPFSKYFNPQFFQGPGSETLFDRAHNMFVEILVTMGLAGELTYIAIFISAGLTLRWLAKRNEKYKMYYVGLVPLIVAYAIHNSFIFDTSANFFIFFAVLAFIAHMYNDERSLSASKEMKNRPSLSGKITPAMITAGLIMYVGAVVLIFNTNIQMTRANYATTRGIVAGWQGNFETAAQKFKESIEYGVPGKYEYRHRGAQYVLEYASSKGIDEAVRNEINYYIGEVQKNADENPKDYLPYLYISRLYIMLGKESPESEYNKKALDNSLKALEISPTFVRTYYEVAQAYLNMKDYAKAIDYFRRSSELNPSVGISYWYWGMAEVERGNVKEGLEIAERAVRNGYALADADIGRLISAYNKIGDYASIAAIYEKLVEGNQSNMQYRAYLAVAYSKIGRIDDAVRIAKETAQLDPSFAPEAKKFVEGLGRAW